MGGHHEWRPRHGRCSRIWSGSAGTVRTDLHAEWERRAFALTLAAGRPAKWNIDMGRFARENRPPADYLTKSYYELWVAGLEALLAERGLVSADEIAAGHRLGEAKKVDGILRYGDVEAALYRGGPTERPATAPARFGIGERVRVRNIHPTTHTRLPRYVRGRPGIIERLYGCHVFPDTNALGQGESPQWLYTVRFEARDLWGSDADPMLKVSVDAWEPYLEPAT
jgi:nitrile hydratase beta subunit